MDLAERYAHAMTFAEAVERARKNQELWRSVYRLGKVPPELAARVRALPGQWHLLVLSEDWCGDAVNTVPLVARLAESAPNVDLRILPRDENPDLMDAHLTGRSRSIPVVIALDEQFRERGWWGPRPRELQSWVLSEGLAMEKEPRYHAIRSWYARDHGRTTLAEIVEMMERTSTTVSQ